MTIFMDSFQYTTAQVPRKWTNLGSGSATVTTGSGAADLYGRALETGALVRLEKFLGQSAVWSISLPFRINLAPTASRNVVVFLDNATPQVSVFLENDRRLHIKKGTITHPSTDGVTTGGTALTGGASTTPLDPDVWYQIEIKATFSASLSANAFQVRITGPGLNETVTIAAAQSTLTTANAWADRIQLFGHTGGLPRGGFYGCMYIDNGQAALLGNVRVAALNPNANGNSSQWLGSDGNSADNYLLVDDATPDDDTTHVTTSTNAQIDLYPMSYFPTTAVSVLAAQWNGQIRKADAADAYVEPVYRIGAVNYVDSPIMAGNAYHNILKATAVSPATALAWTQYEIETMEVGYRSSL